MYNIEILIEYNWYKIKEIIGRILKGEEEEEKTNGRKKKLTKRK
jgi:hypothetical protein